MAVNASMNKNNKWINMRRSKRKTKKIQRTLNGVTNGALPLLLCGLAPRR